MNEQQRIQALINKGYKVEVVNPNAQNFNQKYRVYKVIAGDEKIAILDESGKVIAEQG